MKIHSLFNNFGYKILLNVMEWFWNRDQRKVEFVYVVSREGGRITDELMYIPLDTVAYTKEAASSTSTPF